MNGPIGVLPPCSPPWVIELFPQTKDKKFTTTEGGPTPRYDHTTIRTGSEMIDWGGQDGSGLFRTGGRYTP
jgi:hypothetical protein